MHVFFLLHRGEPYMYDVWGSLLCQKEETYTKYIVYFTLKLIGQPLVSAISREIGEVRLETLAFKSYPSATNLHANVKSQNSTNRQHILGNIP